MNDKDLKDLLEKCLMLFFPKRDLPKFVKDVRDVYEQRAFLRQLPYSEFALDHILSTITDAVDRGIRFRTLDCLNIVKKLVKRRPAGQQFDADTVGALFALYQRYVFSKNETVQWCVSVFIKDQILSDEQVKWLRTHYQDSEHIANRLLRYPGKNELVRQWAVEVLRKGHLVHRQSEVIALLIDDSVPSIADSADLTVVLWAIYHANVPARIKERLLREHAHPECSQTVLDICLRLGVSGPIEYMLEKWCNRQAAISHESHND